MLGRGVHGAVYDSDFQGRGARLVLWSTGDKLREFVESEQWWRKIVFFDARPKFETFSQVLDDFNIANVALLAPPENAQNICVIDTGIAAGNPFLEPVLQADISRSFIRGYSPTVDAVGHGSGVASLASYYQLDIAKGGDNRATARVISARITDDNGQFDTELTPDQIAAQEGDARLLSNVKSLGTSGATQRAAQLRVAHGSRERSINSFWNTMLCSSRSPAISQHRI